MHYSVLVRRYVTYVPVYMRYPLRENPLIAKSLGEKGPLEESQTSGSDLLDSFSHPVRTTTFLCDAPVVSLEVEAPSAHLIANGYAHLIANDCAHLLVDDCLFTHRKPTRRKPTHREPSHRKSSAGLGADRDVKDSQAQRCLAERKTSGKSPKGMAIKRLTRTLRQDRAMLLVGDNGL